MKKLPLFLLAAFSFILGIAQNQLIKGKVTDENGKPLAGISVVVKNTQTTTISDSLGNFEIKTGGQEKLVLSIYSTYHNKRYE